MKITKTYQYNIEVEITEIQIGRYRSLVFFHERCLNESVGEEYENTKTVARTT